MHGTTRAMDFSSSSESGASSRVGGDDPFMLHTQDGLRETGAGETLYVLRTQEGLRKIGADQQYTSTQLSNRQGQARAMEFASSQASSSGGAASKVGEADSCMQNLSWKAGAGPQYTEEGHPNNRPLNTRRSGGIGRGIGGGQSSAMEGGSVLVSDDSEVQAQLSLLALLLAAFRRSGLTCQSPQDEMKMDIGWPTNVQHVTHVTFDRFNGFLGLPVEFELEIPRRVPSASASVFGVSAESMQCSYDRHGNSVPTILLLLQERLYDQGGLKAEGIFRINAENSQEEHVRDQLNKGNVPTNIDVHCLAGLIKAWLRELPRGVLDSLPPDQLLQCNSEEECLALVRMLPSTQAALLDWAVNLMADVVEEEEANKMNARNVAMVFAPNMTQMSDPLTALMHAVQVMNFLKTLILKILQDRQACPKGCKPATTSGLGLPTNVNWQERMFSSSKLNRKEKSGDKIAHDNEPLLSKNGIERKGSMDHQEKCSVNVEERFFRGFSGRDTADDYISSTRLALSGVHASVF